MRAPEGYSVEREGAHAVALDLAIDEELLREGHAREIVHAVQNARKTAGLEVEDRIELALDGDRALLDGGGRTTASTSSARRSRSSSSSATARARGRRDGLLEQTEIDGLPLSIALSRAVEHS